jgi:hypothetical protein
VPCWMECGRNSRPHKSGDWRCDSGQLSRDAALAFSCVLPRRTTLLPSLALLKWWLSRDLSLASSVSALVSTPYLLPHTHLPQSQ